MRKVLQTVPCDACIGTVLRKNRWKSRCSGSCEKSHDEQFCKLSALSASHLSREAFPFLLNLNIFGPCNVRSSLSICSWQSPQKSELQNSFSQASGAMKSLRFWDSAKSMAACHSDVKCCFEHVWTSKLSKSNSWIRENCFPFGTFAPAPHLESSLRSRVLLRRRRCEAWATMPSGNFTHLHAVSKFFDWFCICFPSRSDTVPWYRPSRFHNGGLHPRRPCPGSLAWISMKTLKTYQQQVRCCLVINILDFTWCSFDLLACLSLNADAFSWKSVISRFHDLIQAAAARLVWSTAVARRRSGWVALGVAVELFIAVLFKPPLSLSMCHQHCLSAKWLHRSSEDGVWWDIKLLQDVQSDVVTARMHPTSNCI